MITDDDLENIPDDPEYAFVVLEEKLRSRTADALDDPNGNAQQYHMLTYITKTLALKDGLDLSILSDWSVPARDADIFSAYSEFSQEVDRYTTLIRVRRARRIKKYSIPLDGTAKAKLRHWLNQIKEFVDKLDVSEDRRQSLYNKISALDADINRNRTPIEAFASLWLGFCDKTGEGFEKLEPVRKWVDSIAELLGKLQGDEEKKNPQLPPPSHNKQIEPPKRQITNVKKDDLDDEIPF